MEKLLKLFLSILVLFSLFSCKNDKEQSLEILEYGKYYQGSSQSLNPLSRAAELDSTNAEIYRELSIPYLKRGLPHIWKKHIDKAVLLNPIEWQGFRGYNYLWFYRDYKKAIADFDASDTLTPNFIDAPQGHSVDYWRGIAYLGLKNYEKSNWYFEKHITKETEDFGEDYVDVTAFLYNGISYFEAENYEKALLNFEKQLKYSRNLSADAKYYKAILLNIDNQVEESKMMIDSAIIDFNSGYYNNRPYVETLRQIYLEDLENFKNQLQLPK